MLVLGIVSVFFVATVDERSGGDTFYVCRHLGRGVVTLPEVCYTMSSRNFPNRKRPFSIIRQPEHDGQQIIRVDDFHPSGRPFPFPYATKKEGKKHTHTHTQKKEVENNKMKNTTEYHVKRTSPSPPPLRQRPAACTPATSSMLARRHPHLQSPTQAWTIYLFALPGGFQER